MNKTNKKPIDQTPAYLAGLEARHASPVDMQVAINESIQVVKGLDRLRYGSCNTCTHTTEAEDYKTVTEIQLRGLNLRLCPACAGQLKLAL